MLYEIAAVPAMPVAEFFPASEGRKQDDLSRKRMRFVETREGSVIADLFAKIAHDRRRAIVNHPRDGGGMMEPGQGFGLI